MAMALPSSANESAMVAVARVTYVKAKIPDLYAGWFLEVPSNSLRCLELSE
ncbi:hypothetical protein D9M73_213030 [compost metagenome]